MSESNSGRTALVTGGAVGIGKGIALALAARGFDLAISHCGEEEQALTTAEAIERNHGRYRRYRRGAGGEISVHEYASRVDACPPAGRHLGPAIGAPAAAQSVLQKQNETDHL
ncbi:hypothetical protein SD70_25065 [Gordoniibacillus kamchatkensis]|uniref:Uncharacterized protein n=1 Tax=Gordoniibacillus kamchatkensis TaxID=1590651 RepID=A0ABR5AC74_9BACL|nr:hypothetical protein [Paenibacillus sp. VKM B-2647]KIL38641.1 hypothetical protein SD70_25065 [Paenibacillus sp. VKM B-2647]